MALVESPIDLFKSQVQYQIVKQRQSPDSPLLFRNVFQCASYIWRHGSLPGVRTPPSPSSLFPLLSLILILTLTLILMTLVLVC